MGASAAQFTLTKARADLRDRLWTARAMSSLPVPVSPEMNTVESVGATLAIRERAVFSVFEEPTISSNIEGAVDLVAQRQIFPIELILERPDLCFVSLSFAEIERERNSVVPSCVKERTANQHGDATAILPEELLLVRPNRPRRLEIRRRAFVSLAPFSGRQFGPAHTTRNEIFTTVLQHAEKRIIGLENPSIKTPDQDPNDVRINQSSNTRLALLEIAIETRVLQGHCRRRSQQPEDGHARGGERVRREAVLKVQQPDQSGLLEERKAQHRPWRDALECTRRLRMGSGRTHRAGERSPSSGARTEAPNSVDPRQ